MSFMFKNTTIEEHFSTQTLQKVQETPGDLDVFYFFKSCYKTMNVCYVMR